MSTILEYGKQKNWDRKFTFKYQALSAQLAGTLL